MLIDLTKFTTGFSDRLRQVTYCAAIAELLGYKSLYIKEQKSEHCPYDLSEIASLRGFEIYPFDGQAEPSVIRMDDSDSYPNLSHARLHKPNGMKVSDQQILRLWLSMYPRLVASAAIQRYLEDMPRDLRLLGIHVRMTDRISDRPKSYQLASEDVNLAKEKLIKKILCSFRASSYDKVYLACDDKSAKQEWFELLNQKGIPILTHPALYRADSLRQTSAVDFGVDLFSLARCSQILGLVSSGVARSSAWMAAHECYWFAGDHLLHPLTRWMRWPWKGKQLRS